jgi:uncharacterized protein (DUF1778 family)
MKKAMLLKDVPEKLIRQAKAAAALRGVTLKQFVMEAIERGVNESAQPAAKGAGRKAPKKQKPRR